MAMNVPSEGRAAQVHAQTNINRLRRDNAMNRPDPHYPIKCTVRINVSHSADATLRKSEVRLVGVVGSSHDHSLYMFADSLAPEGIMEIKVCASIDPASSASLRQAALREVFESEKQHLLWLAEAIVGDPLVARSCLAAAMLRANESAYVAPEWRNTWIRRCVARDAVERKSTEITRVVAKYMRDAVCKRSPDNLEWNKEAIACLPANNISQSLNALERAALILHAHLGFSTHDCALLIGCHWSLIEPACSNAVERILREKINAPENAAEFGFSEVPA